MAEGSVIGRGSVVRGNVRGEGNLEILGRVEGDVSVTGDVTLGEEAMVRGNIAASQVSVSGAVQGDLRGNEAVLVERGGRVIGDLTSPRIGIAPGALVRGTVRTDGEAPLATPQSRRPGIGQPLRPSAMASPPRGPAVAVAYKPEPVKTAPLPPALPADAMDSEEEEESPPAPARREAPPPVVPSLGKNAKAKKKKREG